MCSSGGVGNVEVDAHKSICEKKRERRKGRQTVTSEAMKDRITKSSLTLRN